VTAIESSTICERYGEQVSILDFGLKTRGKAILDPGLKKPDGVESQSKIENPKSKIV
jgi:hypothetical protein